MSDASIPDNYINNQFIHQTDDINTNHINSFYQKFYSINCINTKNSHPYPRSTKDTLTNRDVYNCTDK